MNKIKLTDMSSQTLNTSVFLFFTSKVWLLVLFLGVWQLLDQRQCCAQGTFYTDRSAFIAALQSSTTVGFESLTPSTQFSLGTSPITDSGVTITSGDNRLFVCNASTGVYPIPGDGQYIWNFDSSYPVGVVGPNGMNAFGADFSGGIVPQNNPFNGTLTFNLVGGQIYTYNFTGQVGSWAFRGFVFPNPISSLVYNDGGPSLPGAHEEMLDNVTFGFAVPEPQTSVLALAGLAFAGALRSRKRG